MQRTCVLRLHHRLWADGGSLDLRLRNSIIVPFSYLPRKANKPITLVCSRVLIFNHVRGIQTSAILSKEPSKVEETVKVLKDSQKLKGDLEVLSQSSASNSDIAVVKRSLGKRVWDEIVHYYHGFRLLFIDVRVSFRLARKVLNADDLTRREHRQLVRTVSDLFRLVPFSVFVIVPFMEFLLPVVLKFFPAMLPSTFQTLSDKETKSKAQLKVKIEMAKFLQDTLDEMAVQAKGEAHSQNAKEFVLFFEKIRVSGEEASNAEIIKFSKLFEDEITLDSLTRPQLMALCRLLELQTMGTNNFLRFQLRMKLRSLKADDQMIKKEGIDSLNVAELQAACRARGMRALGMPEERLRSQLTQWLELSLNEQIPPSLLLLSRALYLPESLPAHDQLKATISALPEAAATEAKYKIGEMEGKVDNRTKLQLIKQEEENIKKEAEERRQEQLENEEQKKEEGKKIDLKDILPETLAGKDSEIAAEKKVELSKEDFHDLEDAIENLSQGKRKLMIEKEELEDLKEEMDDYKQDVQEFKEIVQKTGHKDLQQSKAAIRLSKKVNRMISSMDHVLDELSVERKSLQQQLDRKAKEGLTPGEEKDNIISINELLLAIRRLQKISDDTKLQRITDVLEQMDVDQDGAVEVQHVLKVIELLGEENVKITGKQMGELMQLLRKEDSLELEEKKHKQKETEE